MLHASKILHQGHGLAGAVLKRAATVELDWEVRQKSRFECTDSQGRQLGVFLPRGTVVRGGDVLVTEDGSLVRVVAAPQPVLRVQAMGADSAFDLVRAAYHLGNRHVAVELRADYLQIEPDHVLAEMLRGMRLAVLDTFAAFEPEAGAYAGQTTHIHEDTHRRHRHKHDPDHEHDTQVHDHEHDSERHSGEHGESVAG